MTAKNRLRRDNFIRILEALWIRPNRSRADLARELRLDRSTVGLIIEHLIELGFIVSRAEEGAGSKGGRPPVLLSIAANIAYSIGVELTYPQIRLHAVDLCGKSIAEKNVPISTIGPQTIHTLAVEAARFRASLDPSFSKGLGLVSLGVGVSGHVDDTGKNITLSHALHITSPLSVVEPLETVLSVPVTLLNDAQVCVLREAGLRGKKDLILTLIEIRPGNDKEDFGIGVGLVLGGTLIRGRVITHLLRPHATGSSAMNNLGFIEELGRSLSLMGNVTGVNEIVLGGDIETIFSSLESAINRFSATGRNGQKEEFCISQVSGGDQAIAAGAAYSAFKSLFNNLSFPISLIVTK